MKVIKTMCLGMLLVAVCAAVAAHATGPCIDPMGGCSGGDGDKSGNSTGDSPMIDPNGEPVSALYDSCDAKWHSCQLGCHGDQRFVTVCEDNCWTRFIGCLAGKPAA